MAADTLTKISPIVYLHGETPFYGPDAWYRIDVESLRLQSVIDPNKPKTKCWACNAHTVEPGPEPLQLSPFAKMDSEPGGTWTIVGDDIYYVGGRFPNVDIGEEYSRNLFKLDITNPNFGWKILSSSRNYARSLPFVASIGRKLYVLGGFDRNERDLSESKWGEFYDLDHNTWKKLELDIKSLGYYREDHCVVVEKEGEPTRILVFRNDLTFYDVITGESFNEDHPSFHVYLGRGPEGLEACENFDILGCVLQDARPVVNNSTLYWFTFDFYLYGYDLVEKRWFQSQCLKTEIWTIQPGSQRNDYFYVPILVDLRNGKFLVIFPHSDGKSEAAILVVAKEKDSLNVSVESLHALAFESIFIPSDAMVVT